MHSTLDVYTHANVHPRHCRPATPVAALQSHTRLHAVQEVPLAPLDSTRRRGTSGDPPVVSTGAESRELAQTSSPPDSSSFDTASWNKDCDLQPTCMHQACITGRRLHITMRPLGYGASIHTTPFPSLRRVHGQHHIHRPRERQKDESSFKLPRAIAYAKSNPGRYPLSHNEAHT